MLSCNHWRTHPKAWQVDWTHFLGAHKSISGIIDNSLDKEISLNTLGTSQTSKWTVAAKANTRKWERWPLPSVLCVSCDAFPAFRRFAALALLFSPLPPVRPELGQRAEPCAGPVHLVHFMAVHSISLLFVFFCFPSFFFSFIYFFVRTSEPWEYDVLHVFPLLLW